MTQQLLATAIPVAYSNPGFPINIAVINATTVLSNASVSLAMQAMQIQVTRDFAPAWGINCNLVFFTNAQRSSIPTNYWQLVLMDTADVAGALGYHDITATGLPLGKVFVKTTMNYHLSWTVTMSHELLEMLVDPYANLTVFSQKTMTSGRLYAYEVCDACEDDQFGYLINGLLVSDFVYPAWFEDFRVARSTQFDFKNRITSPFQLLVNGYIGVFAVPNSKGWQALLGQHSRPQATLPETNRMLLRNMNREQWVAS